MEEWQQLIQEIKDGMYSRTAGVYYDSKPQDDSPSQLVKIRRERECIKFDDDNPMFWKMLTRINRAFWLAVTELKNKINFP